MPAKTFNGPAILIAMLRALDPRTRHQMLEKIRSFSPIIAKLAEDCGFLFQDITRLHPQSVQKILSQIPDTDWLIVWKLASEPVKNCLLRNMTERRREDFLAATKTAPKIKRAQVIRLQLAIGRRIQKLLEAGQLSMR